MVKNYFKVAWRNLFKNKGYSAINIGGFAIGMAVTMLIALWIYDELTFNKYHQNYSRITRVLRDYTWKGDTYTGAYTPLPVGNELRRSFPNDFDYVAISTWTEEHILAVGENTFNQTGNFMEKDAPEILTLKMLNGSRAGLKDINSIMLSETSAKKLFGENDPINKIVKFDDRSNLKVTGVYEDLPANSEFKDVSFIAPFDLCLSTRLWMKHDNWESSDVQVLAQLAPNADVDRVSEKIKNIQPGNLRNEAKAPVIQFRLHAMPRWHLYEEFKQGVNTGGRIQFVWLFGIIGVFVLLLACINFIKLSTARSEKRAKEVGIRRAIGSLRNQLINQFLSESFLVASLALLSIGMVQLTLPWFNEVANKEIRILWTVPLFWILGIGFTFFTGMVAGSYPALYLSSFQPVEVLKGTFKVGRYAAIPRRVLVVLQFTVSVALIIGTIIVYRQVQFTKNRSAGYSSDGLIYVQMKSNNIHDHYDAVRNDLQATGAISGMAESAVSITRSAPNNGGFEWKGKDPDFQDHFVTEWVNHDYGKTVGWQFIDGRNFSRDIPSDSTAYIINETAAKYMNLENPVGELMRKNGKTSKIIGVIKDVIAESPYQPVRPVIASILQWPGSVVTIKLNAGLNLNAALAKIEPVFKKYVPGMPFDYKFVDEEYAKKFEGEERTGKLAGFFSILAICISCLGLFGLASFVAEQRRKEIGLRKVLGATVVNVWSMLSKEFVLLVLLSCFIAIPIAYYLLHKWLQNYEYRTRISWWVFAAAGAGVLMITILTVSFQAIKAGIANPVKSLRTE